MNERLQKEYLLNIIDGGESLVIPICDDMGAEIGVMRPVTTLQLKSNDIIEKLTNWRNQYKVFFLTQFNATPTRTRQWLENVVLSNPNRLMFLIYHGDILIGHYGFKELDEDSALLDNAMRGARGGHPMLMKYAASALIKWLFDIMRVNEIYGYTFADNAMALKLNRDLGFTFAERIPLQKHVDGDEIEWVVGKAGVRSSDNHYYQKLVMKRDSKAG